MKTAQRIEEALTSIRHCWEYTSGVQCPASLAEALSTELPHIAPETWQKRLSWGGVYLNGRSVTSDCPLSPPCRLEYFEPKFDIEDARRVFPEFSREWIVFEDEDLLIVYKPAGLPSLPVREQKYFNMKSYLCAYTGAAVHLPSRLDTATSGLMAVSKTERMHGCLQKLFEKRRAGKTYLFEADGQPAWRQTTVNGAIARDAEHAVLRKIALQGGKPASTLFQVQYHCSPHSSIILARPLSGRTHQIRVHAQSLGLPVVGDSFYGGRPAPHLHLLSYRLELPGYLGREPLTATLPERFIPDWLDAGRLAV